MALLFIDSCDTYTDSDDSAMQEKGWTSNSWSYARPDSDGGRFGTGAITVTSVLRYLAMSINPGDATCIVQGAFYSNNPADFNSTYSWVNFMTNGGTDLCAHLALAPSGAIYIYDQSDSLVGTSSNGLFRQNSWHYVEIKVVVGDSGSVTVKVDGVQVLNVTAIDTKPGTETSVDQVRFWDPGGDMWWDDIIMMDGTGSECNDFIGDVKITTLMPTSDDAVNDWSNSGGGGAYADIDDPIVGTHNGDTDYIYSATPTDKSLFGYENLASTPAAIYAVNVLSQVKKDDAGARTMGAYLDSNGTTDSGSAFSPTTGYLDYQSFWTLDPDTSAAWTYSGVNALLAGVELVS
jgi:hypothetical protein